MEEEVSCNLELVRKLATGKEAIECLLDRLDKDPCPKMPDIGELHVTNSCTGCVYNSGLPIDLIPFWQNGDVFLPFLSTWKRHCFSIKVLRIFGSSTAVFKELTRSIHHWKISREIMSKNRRKSFKNEPETRERIEYELKQDNASLSHTQYWSSGLVGEHQTALVRLHSHFFF